MSKKPEQTRDLLHSFGLRYSKPRDIILDYFQEKDRHTSADNLFADLKQRGHNFSLSTVYLNLSVLKNAGLIRELRGLAGEAIFDSNLSPHNHLVCEHCGEVMDVPIFTIEGEMPSHLLKEHAERATGWKVKEPALELRGLCLRCQENN